MGQAVPQNSDNRWQEQGAKITDKKYMMSAVYIPEKCSGLAGLLNSLKIQDAAFRIPRGIVTQGENKNG